MRRSTSLGNLNRTPIAGRYHGQGRAELFPLLTLICFLVFMSRTPMRDNPTGWCDSVWQIGSFYFAERKTPLPLLSEYMLVKCCCSCSFFEEFFLLNPFKMHRWWWWRVQYMKEIWRLGWRMQKSKYRLENAQHMHYYSATLMNFCSEISVECGSCISSSFLSFI
jgi:hypothetical protein